MELEIKSNIKEVPFIPGKSEKDKEHLEYIKEILNEDEVKKGYKLMSDKIKKVLAPITSSLLLLTSLSGCVQQPKEIDIKIKEGKTDKVTVDIYGYRSVFNMTVSDENEDFNMTKMKEYILGEKEFPKMIETPTQIVVDNTTIPILYDSDVNDYDIYRIFYISSMGKLKWRPPKSFESEYRREVFTNLSKEINENIYQVFVKAVVDETLDKARSLAKKYDADGAMIEINNKDLKNLIINGKPPKIEKMHKDFLGKESCLEPYVLKMDATIYLLKRK